MTEAELYAVYKGVYMPALLHPPHSLKYYEDFSFRQDDILVATYPKSGEFITGTPVLSHTVIIGSLGSPCVCPARRKFLVLMSVSARRFSINIWLLVT